MGVRCPAMQWPSVLEERGPAEDPSILLAGTARIGDTPVEVVAIRIDPALRRAPDYRQNLPSGTYDRGALETILGELEYVADEVSALTGSTRRSIVRLATGPYLLWLLPAGPDGAAPAG